MNSIFETFKNIPENFSEIFKHPTAIITLVGVVILILAFIKIKSIKITTRIMAHIGIVLALSTVLSMITIFKMPSGGSVTLASMVPIIIISLLYGVEVGLLTGFLFGIIQFILGPYIMHPVQVLFDYPLPFMALGLAGLLKDQKLFAPIPALLGRFVFHYLSGVIFFASYAPEGQSPYIYSLLYNGAYLLPELIIAMVVLALLPLDNFKKVLNQSKNI
jgi:thiamine transporter